MIFQHPHLLRKIAYKSLMFLLELQVQQEKLLKSLRLSSATKILDGTCSYLNPHSKEKFRIS